MSASLDRTTLTDDPLPGVVLDRVVFGAFATEALQDRVARDLVRVLLVMSWPRVPNESGRCIGMPKAESPDQMPWRSGSPHGVFGAE